MATLHFFHALPEPERGPTLINATRLSATQIVVHWNPLSLEKARGFITKYTVIAQAVDSHLRQEGAMTMIVDPNEQRAVVVNLNPVKAYVIMVSASTVVGASTENDMMLVEIIKSTTTPSGIQLHVNIMNSNLMVNMLLYSHSNDTTINIPREPWRYNRCNSWWSCGDYSACCSHFYGLYRISVSSR